jgi:ceramide glucosyltransferase
LNWGSVTGQWSVLKILFWMTALVPATNIITVVFTIIYQRYWYVAIKRPGYDQSERPRCSIIIPCKGVVKNFEENLRAFLNIDYPDYEVLYVVESEQDAATARIRKVIQASPNAQLVVAGHSRKCGQKNWNLLAAVNAARNPEVLVFADSDIEPRGHWLKELILPLSDPSITVTTAFRWLHVKSGGLGALMHFYSNAFIYAIFSFASFVGVVGLWGGSMALRKKDFENMEVARRWAETVVDDSSLAELVLKHRRKAILVPTGITCTDDAIHGVGASMRWLERQAMFLKYYQRWLWLCIGFPACALAVASYLWLPVAAGAAVFSGRNFFASGGAIALVFIAGETLAASMYRFLGPVGKTFEFLLMAPLIRFLHAICYFRTHLSRTVTWSGSRYRMSFTGKVVGIDRMS